MERDLMFPFICLLYIAFLSIFLATADLQSLSCSKMMKGLDTSASYELCHKQHWVMLPKNFRIWIPLRLDEGVFPADVSDVVLDLMFIVHSPNVWRAIQHVIGEELLVSIVLHFLYPSNFISIFLSNTMDLMKSPLLLQLLAQKVIQDHFIANNKLSITMQHYDLWSSMALVEGLFFHS